MSDLTTLVDETTAQRNMALLRSAFTDVMTTAHARHETPDFESALATALRNAAENIPAEEGFVGLGLDMEAKGRLFSLYNMDDNGLMREKMIALVDAGLEAA